MNLRNPQQLPSWAITGTYMDVVDDDSVALAGSGRIITGSVAARTWAGRPIGIADDSGSYPILWTMETLAGFRGLGPSAYAILGPLQRVLVNPGRAGRPLRPPRAVIYTGPFSDMSAITAISSQLTAAGIVVAQHTSGLSTGMGGGGGEFGGADNALAASAAPTDRDLFAHTASDAAEILLALPKGEPSQWSGGEVLFLGFCQFADGLHPFSYTSEAGPVMEEIPDIADASRTLWQDWHDVYARVRSHVVTYEPPSPPSTAAYNRAKYEAAIDGMEDVTTEDVGNLSGSALNAAVLASWRTAIEDFFDL